MLVTFNGPEVASVAMVCSLGGHCDGLNGCWIDLGGQVLVARLGPEVASVAMVCDLGGH